MKRRVVITGMGVVSSFGQDLESFRDSLLDGISPAGPITVFDPASLPTRIAAEVKAEKLPTQSKDRKVAFGIVSAVRSAHDANRSGASLERFYGEGSGGISFGIGLELFSMPDMIRLRKKGEGQNGSGPDSLTFLQTPSDLCIQSICEELKLYAPPLMHISACSASTDAIGTAFKMIQSGRRAWMIAGGTDSMINPMGVAGFCKIQAMTRNNDAPKKASRPFDSERDGFLLGEGAAALVLEPLDEAIKRGAKIYAEILGYGNSFDAHGISEPHPEGEGACLSMTRALRDALLSPEHISHISAHGTSTPKNDLVETMAIRKVFGHHADSLTVNSTKSMIGHLISASGAVESAALVVCANAGWAHPTINIENRDPQCDLNYVPKRPVKLSGKYFLKNSFAFGGQNASLVFALHE